MPTLDVLYLIASICLVLLTVLLLVLGLQLMQVLRDVSRISEDVEHISSLIERIAEVVFPGLERVARRVDHAERKAADAVNDFINNFKKK